MMLIVGPISIVGWYAITRGRIELTASGNRKKCGKLFKGWHFIFTSSKDNYVEVSGLKLEKIWLSVYEKFPLKVNESRTAMFFENDDYEIIKGKLFLLSEITGCKVLLNQTYVSFYINEKKYVFPEWVRDPLSECPTCMASIYGSIFYWTMYALNKPVFENPVIFWIIFCVSCAYINTLLAKKL